MTSGTLKRRPIRGALWGLLLGIGATALLMMYSVIALGTLTPWLVLAGFVVLGILWGLFGPAKRTRDLPPSRVRSVPEATTAPGRAGETKAAATEEADETKAAATEEADETKAAATKEADETAADSFEAGNETGEAESSTEAEADDSASGKDAASPEGGEAGNGKDA